jgi:hypothetical protein
MVAKRTFLDNLLLFVPVTNSIRASHHAIFTTDAFLFVDKHHVGLWVTIASTCWANMRARRVLALLTHCRQPVSFYVWPLAKRLDL